MRSWTIHISLISLFLAATLVAACSTSPTQMRSTQTGRIADVRIGDSLNPKEIEVRHGDEVRFVNARSAPIKVEFVESLKDSIACQNGFVTSRFSEEGRNINITTIKPDKYASLCFLSPGVYHYTARMESPVAGGEKNLAGQVRVE